MKIKIFILLIVIFSGITVSAQKASGYMGKRFSVSASAGFNPFLFLDYTTQKRFYNNSSAPGLSTRFGLNAQYAIAEQNTVGIDFSLHHNIIVLEDPFKPYEPIDVNSSLDTVHFSSAFKVQVMNINPVIRFYNGSMSPAPVGNFYALGINYTMVKLDSAKEVQGAYGDLQQVGVLNNNGKFAFFDLSLAAGRSFMIKDKVLLRVEMVFPYTIRAFSAVTYFSYGGNKLSHRDMRDDPDLLETVMRKKIITNNWFHYNISVGIPF